VKAPDGKSGVGANPDHAPKALCRTPPCSGAEFDVNHTCSRCSLASPKVTETSIFFFPR
jgi:hypothetical protein